MAPDLDGKRLELLKEAFPKVARVAFLWQPGGTGGKQALTEMEAAARRWESNFYRLRCEALTISTAHSRERKGSAQALITLHVHRSLISNIKCWTSRPRTGCRRCTQTVSGLRPAA